MQSHAECVVGPNKHRIERTILDHRCLLLLVRIVCYDTLLAEKQPFICRQAPSLLNGEKKLVCQFSDDEMER